MTATSFAPLGDSHLLSTDSAKSQLALELEKQQPRGKHPELRFEKVCLLILKNPNDVFLSHGKFGIISDCILI